MERGLEELKKNFKIISKVEVIYLFIVICCYELFKYIYKYSLLFLFVCPIGLKFCVGPHMTPPGNVYGYSELQKVVSM